MVPPATDSRKEDLEATGTLFTLIAAVLVLALPADLCGCDPPDRHAGEMAPAVLSG